MHFIFLTIYRISQTAGVISGLLLIFIVLLILAEIVLRTFFASSTYVLDEFVGYGVAAMTFLSLGYTLEHGELVRVNVLLSRVSARIKRLLEIAAASLSLALTSLFAWFFLLRLHHNWDQGIVSNSIAEVPMWIPLAFLLLGLGTFWLQLLAYLLRMIICPATMLKPYARVLHLDSTADRGAN